MEVILEDIPAMYRVSISCSDPQLSALIPTAYDTLANILHHKLEGRMFYGTTLNNEYRANVAINQGDDVQKLGLQQWVIPGGKYVKQTMKDWKKQTQKIADTFGGMIAKVRYDEKRPLIEFYRTDDEVDLLVPVK